MINNTFKLIKKLRRLPTSIKGMLSSTAIEEDLYHRFSALHTEQDTGEGKVLLVQCVEDPFYLAIFGQIASSLRAHQPVRVEQYMLRSMNVGETNSLQRFLLYRCLINPVYNRKWARLYSSFCDGIAYKSISLKPLSDLIDFYRAWRGWRKLMSKEMLLDLTLGGILVGDLIYDSYLRTKPAPTVRMGDMHLLILIWQAHRDIRRSEAYFCKVRPIIYLTSYSTYIQHGIAVRVALKHGVHVYSFGNGEEYTKKLSLNDWYQTKNPESYACDFIKMASQEDKLTVAETSLKVRLSGGIDSATLYMRQSAYAESGKAIPNVNGAVVIFLHDFYDSPHVYPEIVFVDFWEWICFTIDTLTEAGIYFFVKPHPNQISLSEGVMSDLICRYPDLKVIPKGVNNRQLVDAGMVCGVTVYGTVAHELAYFGVPSVTCARHPHISFDFCRTAKNKDEYTKLLYDCIRIHADRDAMRRQSLAFYYMHNLNLDEHEEVLNQLIGKFRVCCERSKNISEVMSLLIAITKLRGYEEHIMAWLDEMNETYDRGEIK